MAHKTPARRRRPAGARILKAADRLLYSEGIHAVGIDRILEEAGVVKASLYSNFESKDQLVAEYLRQRSQRWRNLVETDLAKTGGSPEQKILRIFELLGKSIQEPDYRGCPFINAVAEFPDPKHPVQVITAEHRHWLRALFQNLAKAAHLKNVESLVTALMMLYDGALVAGLLDKESEVLKSSTRAADALISSAKSPLRFKN